MTTWSDRALTRLPPVPAMRLTAVVLAPVLAAATLAGLVAGPAAVIWCALGVMCGLPVGATRVRTRVVVGAIALSARTPTAGLAVQGHTWPAAAAVAAAALAQFRWRGCRPGWARCCRCRWPWRARRSCRNGPASPPSGSWWARRSSSSPWSAWTRARPPHRSAGASRSCTPRWSRRPAAG